MTFRFPIRLAFLALMLSIVATMPTRAQDLKTAWDRIQAHFLGSQFDSVIVEVQPFIGELQKQNLLPQLSVAYYHYGISLAEVGRMAESDSILALAKQTAVQAKEPARVKEIAFKQIQLYLRLAQGEAGRRGELAMVNRALSCAGETGDPAVRAVVLYQRGVAHRTRKEDSEATTDFESALASLPADSANAQLRTNLVAQLTTLYLNAGETEKAKRLTQGSAESSERREYTIKLAADAEQRGDLQAADRLLGSVQSDVLRTQDEARIVDFARKRYSFYLQRGLTDTGIDTLSRLTDELRRLDRSPGAMLQLQQFLALLYVQNARVREASQVVAGMKEVVNADGMPPSVASLVEQTEADIAYLQGDNRTAITYYRQVLSQPTPPPAKTLLAVLNNLGLALMKDGQEEEALASFNRMSATARTARDTGFQIQADLNAGILLVRVDRLQEAIERFKKARSAAELSGDASLQVMASLRLGEAYRRSGDDNLADALFDDVRSAQSKLENQFQRVQVLQALAVSAKGPFGSYMAIQDLKQAYDLASSIGARGYYGMLAANLADAYFNVDSLPTAQRYYRIALDYYNTTQDIRTTTELRYKMGQCALAGGDFRQAREEIRGALRDLLQNPAEDPIRAATTEIREVDLYGQGLASLAFVDVTNAKRSNDIRQLLTALTEAEKAIDLLEAHQLSQLSRAQKDLASVRNVNAYRLMVDIATELFTRTKDTKYYELGFNTSEKSRAESFVADVGTQLITKIHDPRLKEAAGIAEVLVSKKSSEAGLALDLTSTAAGTRGLVASQEDVSRGLDKVQQKYEDIVKKIAREDRKAAQLISVNTLNLGSLVSFLEPDEVVLSYYMSIQQCYLFLISSSGSRLKVIHWSPDDIAASVEGFRMAIQDRERQDFYVLGQTLYDSLIAPVAKDIAGKKLIIIPSGRLKTLPFSALSNKKRFLVEDFDITVLPNASTIQFTRTGRHLSASPSVLAFGNPDNPRVTRLPGTESEVNYLKKVYAQSAVFLGDDATETRAKESMGGFEIVHIASHGLFNYEFPLLSSLALTPDRENDGFLQVHELYNLNLVNTNLVVLSACETGLSQIKKNDDVIGLVRGFLYAGVPSTVASLWKVDDAATSLLMSNFHLLLKVGNTKEEALRKAQLQLLKNPDTAHPFYWAAFVLYGNGK